MSLASGARLGPYEIAAPVGAGGMGEVYRARDTRLHREVAIKVLPEDVARDTMRLGRFAQEARAAAALNHPNILSVFDVAIDAPTPYLVSELLEGETLAERLRSSAGQMSPTRAVEYAIQVARGLAAAHAHGIVHRDLKPANIFVTSDGRVKLLDFGLAKLSLPGESIGTTDGALDVHTDHGQVLGTLGYMAPEQLRAKAVDARADLFSFGAVLYELLSGRRAFEAGSSADTINAILAKDPHELISSAGQPIAPALLRIVTRCLEKDPAARFQSASDLAFALEAISGSSPALSSTVTAPATPEPPRRWSTSVAVGATALATMAVMIAVWAAWPTSATNASPAGTGVVRFTLFPPEGTVFSANAIASRFSVSPDGRIVAFIAETNANPELWVQPVDSLTARRLAGTQGVSGSPIWSPDSRSLAFYSDGMLKRLDLDGGAIRTIGAAPVQLQRASSARGSWSSSGDIVFGSTQVNPLYRVSASGGGVSQATQAQAEESHVHPSFLPDGRHFVFVIRGQPDRNGIWLASLDNTMITKIVDGATHAAYAAGLLVFVREGVLTAQRFDGETRELTGEPRPLGEGGIALQAGFSVSSDLLIQSPGALPERQFVWVDRSGSELSTVGEPARLGNFDLALDAQESCSRERATSGHWTCRAISPRS